MTARIFKTIQAGLGWCPDKKVLPEGLLPSGLVSGTTSPAGPGIRGGPRDTAPFRVPRDMLGMLIDPVRTLRKSTDIPLSAILVWYGVLAVINALAFGAATYYLLKGTDFEQTAGLSAFWLSTTLISGVICVLILITGFAGAVMQGISRILGRNSTLCMALRVVLYCATPVFLFSWTFFAGPALIHAMLGIDIHDAALVAFSVNLLLLVWALILMGIGFWELHGMAAEETPGLSPAGVN